METSRCICPLRAVCFCDSPRLANGALEKFVLSDRLGRRVLCACFRTRRVLARSSSLFGLIVPWLWAQGLVWPGVVGCSARAASEEASLPKAATAAAAPVYWCAAARCEQVVLSVGAGVGGLAALFVGPVIVGAAIDAYARSEIAKADRLLSGLTKDAMRDIRAHGFGRQRFFRTTLRAGKSVASNEQITLVSYYALEWGFTSRYEQSIRHAAEKRLTRLCLSVTRPQILLCGPAETVGPYEQPERWFVGRAVHERNIAKFKKTDEDDDDADEDYEAGFVKGASVAIVRLFSMVDVLSMGCQALEELLNENDDEYMKHLAGDGTASHSASWYLGYAHGAMRIAKILGLDCFPESAGALPLPPEQRRER